MKTSMQRMMERLELHGNRGEVVQIHRSFKACACAIITMYAFGECMNFMDEPDYGRAYFDATDWFFYLTHVFGQMPGVVHRVQNMPGWLLRGLVPFLSPLRDR
jgi:hypothetical protein